MLSMTAICCWVLCTHSSIFGASKQNQDYTPPFPSIQNPQFYKPDYDQMVAKFGSSPTYTFIKPTTSESTLYRKEVVSQNIEMINEHNQNFKRSYNMEANEFIFLN